VHVPGRTRATGVTSELLIRLGDGMKRLLASLLLIFVWPVVAKADAVQENFNELTPSLNATNLGAFSVTSGAVDLVGGALYGYLCVSPASGNCVDMDGTPGPGTISTGNITLTPGTYLLSFDLLGSQRGNTTSTTVTLGSLFGETFVLTSTDDTSGVVSQLITVGATTIVQLVFTSNDPSPSYNGALLDNVDLKSVSEAVPEPGTWGMLLAGVLMLAGFANRRRATA